MAAAASHQETGAIVEEELVPPPHRITHTPAYITDPNGGITFYADPSSVHLGHGEEFQVAIRRRNAVSLCRK